VEEAPEAISILRKSYGVVEPDKFLQQLDELANETKTYVTANQVQTNVAAFIKANEGAIDSNTRAALTAAANELPFGGMSPARARLTLVERMLQRPGSRFEWSTGVLWVRATYADGTVRTLPFPVYHAAAAGGTGFFCIRSNNCPITKPQ